MDFEALEKLADLKQKGIITEEEFILKKKEMLNIKETVNPTSQTNNGNDNQKVSSASFGLPLYYQEEFDLIKKSNETYRGKFNWNAFALNFFWYFFKGLPLPGLISLLQDLFFIVGIPLIGYIALFFYMAEFSHERLDMLYIEFYQTFGVDVYSLWVYGSIVILLLSSFKCGAEATFKYYTLINRENK